MAHPVGKVYILGAGPGSAVFLTVSGQALLSTAEVVIYDALIDPKLLSLAPKTCIDISVGKRGQGPSMPQSDIDQLLVRHCLQGKRVVRLKSGDPAIFGRVASEIQALQAAGCSFEVWPGLSSALSVPTLAGIPLTDPLLSRSILIVSAHDPSLLDWDLMARSESLVVLMGGRSLSTLASSLQQQGKSADTPIAIIRWGGWPQQQVWTGTLETIVSQTHGETLSPTVMVIGEVVRLRETLGIPNFGYRDGAMSMNASLFSSESSQPLSGQTVLITRSAGQASDFRNSLEAKGARVLEMTALEIGPPSSWDLLDGAITQIQTFDWLILTSANGVQYFLERLQAQGKDARTLAGLKIAVVGRKTATHLKQWGLMPDFIPPNYIADELVSHFPEKTWDGLRCLFPRVESGGREVLVQELSAKGVDVVEVPAYQSQCPATVDPHILQALQQQDIDILTFASSKTVAHFWQLLLKSPPPDKGGNWLEVLKTVKIASIGPQTSQTCLDLLGRVDTEAQEYTLDGLIESIVQNCADSNHLP